MQTTSFYLTSGGDRFGGLYVAGEVFKVSATFKTGTLFVDVDTLQGTVEPEVLDQAVHHALKWLNGLPEKTALARIQAATAS